MSNHGLTKPEFLGSIGYLERNDGTVSGHRSFALVPIELELEVPCELQTPHGASFLGSDNVRDLTRTGSAVHA